VFLLSLLLMVSTDVSLQIRKLPSGEEREIFSMGLACSECFSGPNLARILKPGFEYEQKVMEALANGEYADPLSIHTSAGVPDALSAFMAALEPLLPWDDTASSDWCVSLQLEGASAVWAAIDMLLQMQILETGNKNRLKVAVGETSYHGPPSTSFGGKAPLWSKHYQVQYPVPRPGSKLSEDELFAQFESFLEEHGDQIGVILLEPQWGSSQAGFPWPKSLLKRYIAASKARDIKIACDEIMCGLGRHGMGTMFVSDVKAWNLDPDAITFGKAVGGGVYPISGAVVKRGRELLKANKATVMQSHTYAGSSTRALMTATEVLKEIPAWYSSVAELGDVMAKLFRHLTDLSQGMMLCHGQGLMWGGIFTYDGQNSDPVFREKVVAAFKKHCDEEGVLPYFIPVGGMMISPVIDVDADTIHAMGKRLEEAIKKTMATVGWEGPVAY
jgi:adenosylmethionine-8-amino-7-oxononanoate aminotransferase